jgi:hypothetical protein
MTTAQQQADYWAWQVEIGRGQWESRLCPRGLLGVSYLPKNTHLSLCIPQPSEMYDEKNHIIFIAARLREGNNKE